MPNLFRPCLSLVLAAATSACGSQPAPAGQTEPAGPVTAAIVRGDGYIVPFAQYADGAWQGPAVEPGSLYSDRLTVADRPAPWFADRMGALARWEVPYALSLGDEARGTFVASAATEPASVQSHCQAAWALASNLQATPTPEFTVHRIAAAAFSRAVGAAVVAEIGSASDTARASRGVLETTFNAAEAAELTRRARDAAYAPRRAGAEVAKSPLAYTSLVRVGGNDGWSIYLFEATRTYEAAEDGQSGCDEASVMTGWLVESPQDGFTILSPEFQMTNCDRKGSPLMQPLATLTLDGLTYTIAVAHHYESESYLIFEIENDAIREVLTVDGGGC